MKIKSKKLKMTVALAMLSAISIVCGKYLSLGVGEFMRFSLESMPIIFAGLAFGPLAGGAVGIVADLVGCLMVGWVPIPWVTVGAGAIGVISGGANLLLKKTKLPFPIAMGISVFASHFIGSVLIKTIGLADFYGVPYTTVMLWRVLNYLIIGALDGAIVYFLLNNKGVRMQIKELGGVEK